MVRVDDGLADGQADAGASSVVGAGRVPAIEAFEGVLHLVGCHTFTGVGDGDDGLTALAARPRG